MNCAKGDLAAVKESHPSNPDSAGVFCRVLFPAPSGSFILPNGVMTTDKERTASWVIELARPVLRKWPDGSFKRVAYAVCPDNMLIPFRDNPGQDETLAWAPVPSERVTA